MVDYHYEIADLLTDQTIDELDVHDVRFDRRIVEPGSFSGHIPITSSSIADRARRIVEGRTVVHIYRGADIWGTYLIWVATPGSNRRGETTLDLTGATLESYLDHREIRQSLDYVDTDQLAIARDLITQMQSASSGDIGLALGSETSGVNRERHYARGETATYGRRLRELADVINGFEYAIATFVNPPTGQRARAFVTGYPTIGQQAVDHVFAKPGNVLSWSIPGDATRAATSFQTRGDIATDFRPLMSDIFGAQAFLDAGWPLLDMTESRESASMKETLNAWAEELRSRLSGTVRIPQPVVRLDEDTSWNPNRLGDPVRLILTDEWWPMVTDSNGRSVPSYSRSHRVVGCEVTPISRDDGQEEVRLDLEEPEPI